jgi:hypothetical protein
MADLGCESQSTVLFDPDPSTRVTVLISRAHPRLRTQLFTFQGAMRRCDTRPAAARSVTLSKEEILVTSLRLSTPLLNTLGAFLQFFFFGR